MDQETWGKLSIGGDEAHGQWILGGQRICSNYGWFSFAELLEYEAILYLSAPSFPHRGFFLSLSTCLGYQCSPWKRRRLRTLYEGNFAS